MQMIYQPAAAWSCVIAGLLLHAGWLGTRLKRHGGITGFHGLDLLLPGAVFTIEPGLYYPDKPEPYGVRIEDTYYMDKDGKVSPLTDYPYRLILDVPAK